MNKSLRSSTQNYNQRWPNQTLLRYGNHCRHACVTLESQIFPSPCLAPWSIWNQQVYVCVYDRGKTNKLEKIPVLRGHLLLTCQKVLYESNLY